MRNWFFSNISKKALLQIFRYGFIGIAANIIGYLIYLLFTFIGATPKLTMTVLYGIGATFSFFANKRMTFSHTGSTLGAGSRYIVCYLIGYFINFIILVVMVDNLGYSHQWVQGAAIFVVALFLFLASKYYVFPKNRS